MVSFIAAIVFASQVPVTLTERDRDVLTAYIFSSQDPKAKQPSYFVVQRLSSGGLSKPSMEALQRRIGSQPEFEQFTKSLTERNVSRVPLDSLTWDPKLIFFDLFEKMERRLFMGSEFYKLFQRDVGCFGPTLPGYSADGKSAVVICWLGPNHIHSVHEVAILKLKDGKWVVDWRQFAYYV